MPPVRTQHRKSKGLKPVIFINMKAILLSLAIFYSLNGYAQSPTVPPSPKTNNQEEAFAIAEIGTAANWNKGAQPAYGPTLAFEFTPIKEWLEIEAGATQSYSHSSRELSLDLLFKKPYTLSRTLEFMIGLGPEYSIAKVNYLTQNDWQAEAALDFMYWPFNQRNFGFYAEPAYDYSFSAGHEQSIGVSGGLLISIK
jgi:hypothetical protein